MNILIVDDEPQVRSVMVDVLQGRGHRVFEASTGRQAIELLSVSQVDLIVTDIVMPEIEGVELILRLRQSNIPIVAISGLGREVVVNAFLSTLGIVGFLQKPFAMRGVLELIDAQERLRACPVASGGVGSAGSEIEL